MKCLYWFCPPHAADFQCQRKPSTPIASPCHCHDSLQEGCLFSVCFILLPPDKQLIHWAKKFKVCSMPTQNTIPKLLWLTHMGLSNLELTGVVLFCMSWSFSVFRMHQCLKLQCPVHQTILHTPALLAHWLPTRNQISKLLKGTL